MEFIHIFTPGIQHQKVSGNIQGATLAFHQSGDLLVGGVTYCSSLEPSFSRKQGREKSLEALIEMEKDDGFQLPKSFILPARGSRRQNRGAVLMWFFRRIDSYSYYFNNWLRGEPSPLAPDRDFPEVDLLMGALEERYRNENQARFHQQLQQQ